MVAEAVRLSVVSSEIPDPPYPSDTKANGWKPEQDIQRIKQSRTWVLCPQSFRPWLLMVWMESWESVPVGTYPADDDEMIAARIGMDQHEFEVRRKMLMRGWYRCSDGNLYHPHISEMILKMLSKRVATRERQRAFADRKKAMDQGHDNALDNQDNALVSVSDTLLTDRKQEQEQEQESLGAQGATSRQGKSKPRARFVAPSVAEVAAYVSEKGYTLNPHRFVAHYEAVGWKVGKNPMVDWKAACRSWQARENEQAKPATVFAGDI